jgi:succinate dehydrogenase / fumarate reductase flavoprotein subunit
MGVVNYVRDVNRTSAVNRDQGVYDAVVKQEEDRIKRLLESKGNENPYLLHRELGAEMTEAATVIKSGPRLQKALAKIAELKDRFTRISLDDSGMWTNQSVSFARALDDMFLLAEANLRAGLLREESRGSHFRSDFTDRDDSRFLKTSVAKYDGNAVAIDFEDLPTPLVKPRIRNYGKTSADASKKPSTSSDPAKSRESAKASTPA